MCECVIVALTASTAACRSSHDDDDQVLKDTRVSGVIRLERWGLREESREVGGAKSTHTFYIHVFLNMFRFPVDSLSSVAGVSGD